MTDRRDFLRATSAAAVAGPLLRGAVASAARPKRVAIIAPSWRPGSRTQDLGDRLLVGYPYAGVWQRPSIELASLYVERPSGGDLSAARAAEFGFDVYPSIGEALRCGGQDLAVDAVLLTGGADDPPGSSQPQQTESRGRLFRQIVDVFQQSGQSRPTFNNGQLGADWETAREMVETSRRLGFALLAGSPLPVTWRLPALELPLGCVVEEALLVGGAAQPADYRALEALQCMVERRRGGETGVASLQVFAGDAVWRAASDGRWSHTLLEAALSRSDIMMGDNDHPKDLANNGELPGLVKTPSSYCLEYVDGLRTTVLNFHGAVGDYTFAARVKGMSDLQSTQFLLPPHRTVPDSTCLVHQVVELIQSGAAPSPPERAQLASGLRARCRALGAGEKSPLATPELHIRYHPPRQSHFCQT